MLLAPIIGDQYDDTTGHSDGNADSHARTSRPEAEITSSVKFGFDEYCRTNVRSQDLALVPESLIDGVNTSCIARVLSSSLITDPGTRVFEAIQIK